MKYAYYPGCSAESTARDQYMSVNEVAKALDIELIEIKGWTCCGSTPSAIRTISSSIDISRLNLHRTVSLSICTSRSLMCRLSWRRWVVIPLAPANSHSAAAHTGSGSSARLACLTVAIWSIFTFRTAIRFTLKAGQL